MTAPMKPAARHGGRGMAVPLPILPGHARDPKTGERLSEFAKFVDRVTGADAAADSEFDILGEHHG